ncbi:uncharacterized protein FTOL_13935 [Fusarium torulosum]|uniref:Uncharacterized protein n=1 Tax=Fusarium torulosum TaxID=33205 RepID=A0AAE8SQG1_9HYPO|nr:uncharacterized protein FTOL_13935 [Fusarium torulosum]
MSRKDAGWT